MASANQEHRTKASSSLPYHLRRTTQHCACVDLVSTWMTSRRAIMLYPLHSSPQKYLCHRVFRLRLGTSTSNCSQSYSLPHSPQTPLCLRQNYHSRSPQLDLRCNTASASHPQAIALGFLLIATSLLQPHLHRQTRRTLATKQASGRWNDLRPYPQ